MMPYYKMKSKVIGGVRIKTRIPLTDEEEQQRFLTVTESEKTEQ